MKRKEFIRIVTGAMQSVEEGFSGAYTCNLISFYHKGRLNDLTSSVRKDYSNVLKEEENDNEIEVIFGLNPLTSPDTVKQVRLNALAMYLAQSLAFKTYKDL